MYDTDLCCGKHYINTAHCNMALHDLDQYSLILTFHVVYVCLHVHVCVCVKETKIETFMDGRGHRGSERQTEREMTLFMCAHDQCDQGRLGVFFPGDQQLINQT